MFCSSCGKKIPNDSKFCEKCGATLTEEVTKKDVETTEDIEKTIELDKQTIKEHKDAVEEIKSESKEEKKSIEKNDERNISEKKEDSNSIDECDDENNEQLNEVVEVLDDGDYSKREKQKVAGSHTMLLSNLDDAVADLKPDDFDELMPKTSRAKVIVISLLFLITIIGVFVYIFLINPKEKNDNKNKTDYQSIINEYGKSIEKVAKEYLLEHEIINDYSEIKTLVKYDKHNVSCKNVYVNIDGTVYLSECSVDGVKVSEGYGKNKTGDDACTVKFNSTKNQLEFYVEDSLVSVYECKSSDCGLYEQQDFKYNSCLDSIALIHDGKKIYLYSYDAGQELFDAFSEIIPITLKNKNQTLIVKDYLTEKYGYITLKGTSILKTEYDELGIINDSKLSSLGVDLDNDIIVASKDNKYGVINLSTGKEIISFSYNYITLAPNNNYLVKYGSKYYLVNSNDEKILKDSYEMIFPFDDVIVVNDNNKLRFMDYSGNNIIEDTVDVSGKYDILSDNNDYDVKEKDNEIYINIYKSKTEIISYSYNKNKKELSKLNIPRLDLNSDSNKNVEEE